jgi:hypothetical protein
MSMLLPSLTSTLILQNAIKIRQIKMVKFILSAYLLAVILRIVLSYGLNFKINVEVNDGDKLT